MAAPPKLLPSEIELDILPEDGEDISGILDNLILRALRRHGFNALTGTINLVKITNGQMVKSYMTDSKTAVLLLQGRVPSHCVLAEINPNGPELEERWKILRGIMESSPCEVLNDCNRPATLVLPRRASL